MPKPSRRDHLINTAIQLFCKYGFHATGIDKIMEVSGVSKKTMYTHFRTKDELIMAALRQHDSQFRNFFMREVEKTGTTAVEKLLGIFDVAHAWFSQNNFAGCVFINAVGEFSETSSPIGAISKEFKTLMRSYVQELCTQAHAPDPQALAKELGILLEGAIVTAQVSKDPLAAKTAKEIAKLVLGKALVRQ